MAVLMNVSIMSPELPLYTTLFYLYQCGETIDSTDKQEFLAGIASTRHYGGLTEVASGAAARALQITTLQLPVRTVYPRQ